MEYIDLNIYGTGIENNIITNPLHLFFQEIELGIKMMPGEMWGSVDAINLKKYLFSRFVTMNQIKNEIASFIATNCAHASEFQYTVDAEIINIDNKDLIYIAVRVPKGDNSGDFIQKFLLGA